MICLDISSASAKTSLFVYLFRVVQELRSSCPSQQQQQREPLIT
jgi:hypothetical protein